jgi:hypothetical protein
MSEIKTNQISSLTGSNSDITIDPDGTGKVYVPSQLDVEAATGDATLRVHAAEADSSSEPILVLESSNDFAESIVEFKDSSGVGGRVAYNHGDNALRFQTNGLSERMRITSGGINSATIYNNTTVSGSNLFISGGYNFQRSTSSSRYKTEITDATHGLDEVMNLRPVTYKGINDGDRVFGGLIAEEVHDAGLTEFVDYSEDEDGNERPEGLHYGHMAALAFKAIQELKTGLDAEKAKVADLEARLTALENA